MADCHEITFDGTIAVVRFQRKPSFEEIAAAIDEMADRDIYDRRLWDFTENGYVMSKEQIMQIAAHGRSRFTRPSLIAIVAPEDLTFGVSRMFEVFREEKHHVDVGVFRTLAEGRAWLLNNSASN